MDTHSPHAQISTSPELHSHSSTLHTHIPQAHDQLVYAPQHSSEPILESDEDDYEPQQISFDSFAAYGIDIDLDAGTDDEISSPIHDVVSRDVQHYSTSPSHVRFDVDGEVSDNESDFSGLAYDQPSEDEDLDNYPTPTVASFGTPGRHLTPIHTSLPASRSYDPSSLSPSDTPGGPASSYIPPSPTASFYSQSPASETDGESETSSVPPSTPDVNADWFDTAIAAAHLDSRPHSALDVNPDADRNAGYNPYGEVPRVVVFSADGYSPSGSEHGDEPYSKSKSLTPLRAPPASLSLGPRSSPRSRTSSLSPRSLYSPLPPSSPQLPFSPRSPTFNPLPKPGHRSIRLLQRADLFSPRLPSPYESQMFFLPPGWRERQKTKASQGTKPRQPAQSREAGRRRTAVDEALLRGLRPLILVDEKVVEEMDLETPVSPKQEERDGEDGSEEIPERAQEGVKDPEWQQWSTEGLPGRLCKPKLREEVRMKWETDARRWINIHVAESYERMERRTSVCVA